MTARRITFPTGFYDAIRFWTTGTFEWALLTSAWIQDETTQVFMSSISAAEFTDLSYSRVALTTPTVEIILPTGVEGPGFVALKSDPPEFGILSGGEIAESAVLIRVVTNDADSPIVAAYPVTYTANSINPANFLVASTGTVAASTVCVPAP